MTHWHIHVPIDRNRMVSAYVTGWTGSGLVVARDCRRLASRHLAALKLCP